MPIIVNDSNTPSRWKYMSAYAIAVKHGYTGSEEEWLRDIYGGSEQAAASAAAAAESAEGAAAAKAAAETAQGAAEDARDAAVDAKTSAVDAATSAASAAATAANEAKAEVLAEAPQMVTDWLDDHIDPTTGYAVDDSLTTEGAAADAKAAGNIGADLGVERDWVNLSLATEIRPAPTMQNGWGINVETGSPYESAARCRTQYRLPYRGRTVLECTGSGYQVSAFCYSASSWASGLASLTNGRYIPAPCVIPLDQPPGAVEYAISFRISKNDETISAAMFQTIKDSINVRIIPTPVTVDDTLEVSGAAADAATVGAKIDDLTGKVDESAGAQTGNATAAFLETARNWFVNRLAQVDGAQAMYYHDGHTILDDETAHTTNIECSTFVTLCMRGLQFWDTSYAGALPSPAAPEDWKANPQYYWASNPYSMAYSHYADDTPADPPNTRYAAAVAKLLRDYGLEVSDKSDIRPGDILFFARKVTPGGEYVHPTWFKQINHIGICYAVHTTPEYPEASTVAEMDETDLRYVYRGSEEGYTAGDWYYYKDGAWKSGGPYVDPTDYPYTHEMIHAQKDEADPTRNPSASLPYPIFTSSSDQIGTSSQGSGHGSIFIEPIEALRGDNVNGIDTLCCVCRPAPGTLWDERRHWDAQSIPIMIKTQPHDITTPVKSGIKVVVLAEGDGLSYQWQYCEAGATEWANTSFIGAKTNIMQLSATKARNGFQYRCMITDASGNVAYTRALTLTVL